MLFQDIFRILFSVQFTVLIMQLYIKKGIN